MDGDPGGTPSRADRIRTGSAGPPSKPARARERGRSPRAAYRPALDPGPNGGSALGSDPTTPPGPARTDHETTAGKNGGAAEAVLATAGTRAAAGSPAQEAAPPDAFHHEDDTWRLTCGGAACRLRDSHGLRYVATLLRRPGQEVHVLDLMREAHGEAPEPRSSRSALGEGLILRACGWDATGDPLADAKARAQYRARLAGLRSELDAARASNDPGRIERAEREIEFLTEHLRASLRLGARGRSTATAAGRARSTVCKRIRAALSRIERGNPALAAHFHATLRTGIFCTYQPDPRVPVQWDL